MAVANVPLKKRQASSSARLRAWRQLLSSSGNTLELLLPRGWPEGVGSILWRLRDGAGAAPFGRVNELNQIPGLKSMTRVQVWTPPSDSLLTRTKLPTRSRARIQQALPYALEDQIIGEPEQHHFSYRILEDGSLAVVVTARARMQAWLSQLNAAGLRPTGLCPALLALPLEPGTWTVAWRENEWWIRSGEYSGFTCAASADGAPPTMLPLALREAQEQQPAPLGLTIIHPQAGFDTETWSRQLNLPVNAQKQDFWTSRQAALPPINLLQGGFAPTRQMQEMLPGLRPAAIMLAIWVVGSLGFGTWEWWNLSRTNANLDREMLQVFRRAFPDAQAVQNPALQMQRLWEGLQGKSGKTGKTDALPLLGSIAPVIQAHPQIKLRGIQYGESRLTLDFTLPDFQAMEAVKNAFAARGMQVEVLSANSTPGGIEGRLRLSHRTQAGA